MTLETPLRHLRHFVFIYIDGFRNMTTGKVLWKIIAFKFIVFILIMKLFFFPNFLKTNFSTDEERSTHVLQNLTQGNR
ncbi:MAG: DUF4492 domain-containing protein [Campylobacterota bacterium]|nr:DUF4492 domain-containing protein [Campylobacterota bacterium]